MAKGLMFSLMLLASVSIMNADSDTEGFFDVRKFKSEAYMNKLVDEVLIADPVLKKEQIEEKLETALSRKTLKIKKVKTEAVKDIYSYARERTYKLVTPYNCGKCDKWHDRSATAWALSEDGLMMTNYHCFLIAAEEGAVVVNYDLEAFPLVDILIADRSSDFVVFKVQLPEGTRVKAFPVGEPAHIGSDLHLVSHPIAENYYYSRGHLAGYKLARSPGISGARETLWMLTELGYRVGSSGGGITNNEGEIVGMVSYITPSFSNVSKNSSKSDVKTDDKYAVKVFERAVPVSSMRKRLVFDGE